MNEFQANAIASLSKHYDAMYGALGMQLVGTFDYGIHYCVLGHGDIVITDNDVLTYKNNRFTSAEELIRFDMKERFSG